MWEFSHFLFMAFFYACLLSYTIMIFDTALFTRLVSNSSSIWLAQLCVRLYCRKSLKKKKIPRARWHQQGQKKSHASVRNKYRKKRRYRKSGTQIIKCLFTKFIWSHWTKKYLFVSSPKSTRKSYLRCLNGQAQFVFNWRSWS